MVVLAEDGVDAAEAAAGDTRAVDGHATTTTTECPGVTPTALSVGKNGHAAEGMRLPASLFMAGKTRGGATARTTSGLRASMWASVEVSDARAIAIAVGPSAPATRARDPNPAAGPGVLELAGAVGLLLPQTVRWASSGLDLLRALVCGRRSSQQLFGPPLRQHDEIRIRHARLRVARGNVQVHGQPAAGVQPHPGVAPARGQGRVDDAQVVEDLQAAGLQSLAP